ncbi:isocitrate lyase/PEP mutase family protein [Methyloversatilis sp. NSM2]|uniref:isocitrate lyase/PEP mutase family protein n=1 Tax=Methyloversatilis sp. NSM2 TaxID=3134135 RepID=UPI00310F9543
MSARRMRLRNALAGTRCLNCPSVFDPMSARLAEAAGFGIGILGGSTAALTLLGLPDLNLITLTELCGLTRRIADASDIALIVDADGGYGNALNVMRTVGDLEAAGAAGLSIEDSWLPQAYGRHTDPLIPIDEAADKLRAAVAARRDPSFVLFARTSARACRSDHELIERLTRYADTGVDALCIVGADSDGLLTKMSAHIRLPWMSIGYTGCDLTRLDTLASRGARLHLDGHHGMLAALEAMQTAYRSLPGAAPATPPLSADALVPHLSRLARYREAEHYMKPATASG